MKMMAFIHSTRFRSQTPQGGAWLSRLEKLLLLGCVLAAAPVLGHAAAASAPHAGAKEHSHGYLGIGFQDTSDEQVAALHLQGPRGAEIMVVDHDGPAGQAGLQPHDVVLQVDGQNIGNSEDLSRRIRESMPGRVISLSIMRLGRALTLTAKLADQKELERNAWQQHLTEPPPDDEVANVLIQRYTVEPVPAPKPPSHTQNFIGTVLRTGPYTGAILGTMTPQLAGFFGAPPKSGLLVQGVEMNSPAAFAGLRAGDVVLRVDSLVVSSTSEWTKRLRASNGRAVNLIILRDKHEQSLTMQPDLKRHSLLEWPKLF
jgi:serine protease Do